MIIHTAIYRFSESTTEQEREQFFAALRETVEKSDLILQFGYGPHYWMPIDAKAEGMPADIIAQFTCRNAEDLRKFSELPHVRAHVAHWRSKLTYQTAYANHDDLLGGITGEIHHTEHTVTVDAPLNIVWDVLVDVEGYARVFPPTQEAKILEQSATHQIVRLVVDVSGVIQSWISRRDIDNERHVIGYRQLEMAPLMGHMSGEWRALALSDGRTQLVLTHDFKPRDPVDGKVAGQYTYAEAEKLLKAAVERNSVADLGAVKAEAERITVGSAAARQPAGATA
jgi:aromatase